MNPERRDNESTTSNRPSEASDPARKALPPAWRTIVSSAPASTWFQVISASGRQLIQDAQTGQLHIISPHLQLQQTPPEPVSNPSPVQVISWDPWDSWDSWDSWDYLTLLGSAIYPAKAFCQGCRGVFLHGTSWSHLCHDLTGLTIRAGRRGARTFCLPWTDRLGTRFPRPLFGLRPGSFGTFNNLRRVDNSPEPPPKPIKLPATA